MRRLPLFLGFCVGAVALLALAVTLLFSLEITTPFFQQMAVNGPGSATKGDINFGGAIALFATGGILSIPGALALAALLGDSSSTTTRTDSYPPF